MVLGEQEQLLAQNWGQKTGQDLEMFQHQGLGSRVTAISKVSHVLGSRVLMMLEQFALSDADMVNLFHQNK